MDLQKQTKSPAYGGASSGKGYQVPNDNNSDDYDDDEFEKEFQEA